MNKKTSESGFIKQILLVIIALIALKYFLHFDVIEWIKSDQGQKIFGPIVRFTINTYNFIDSLVKGWVSK